MHGIQSDKLHFYKQNFARPKLICQFCDRPGHVAKNCFKIRPDLREKFAARTNTGGSTDATHFQSCSNSQLTKHDPHNIQQTHVKTFIPRQVKESNNFIDHAESQGSNCNNDNL